MNLFQSGIRPTIDEHIAKLAAEKRDYGDYWSASSAGYCMRKLMFERLDIPYTKEDARKQRVFSAGDIFHEWIQRITKGAGLSLAQELELQDEDLMVRGHIDDLILVSEYTGKQPAGKPTDVRDWKQHLILYDYKSAHSRSFTFSKDRPMSHYHKMQVGTYMYMIRKLQAEPVKLTELDGLPSLSEARVMSISKDDLRMAEKQLLWTPQLEKEVVAFWTTLNGYWKAMKIPKCTCHQYEGGFMAREAYNPFWYAGEPCSLEWFKLKFEEVKESV